MLEPRKDGRFNATCSGCLKMAVVTAEELEAQHWERRPDRQLWCLGCSYAKRQVRFASPVTERRIRRENAKRWR